MTIKLLLRTASAVIVIRVILVVGILRKQARTAIIAFNHNNYNYNNNKNSSIHTYVRNSTCSLSTNTSNHIIDRSYIVEEV